MPIARGHEKGRCKECGLTKTDLFKGFCGDCRRAYGKRQGHHIRQAAPPSNRDGFDDQVRSAKRQQRERLLARDKLYETVLRQLLADLAAVDYSEDAILYRYEQFQTYYEPPDAAILRAILAVRKLEQSKR